MSRLGKLSATFYFCLVQVTRLSQHERGNSMATILAHYTDIEGRVVHIKHRIGLSKLDATPCPAQMTTLAIRSRVEIQRLVIADNRNQREDNFILTRVMIKKLKQYCLTLILHTTRLPNTPKKKLKRRILKKTTVNKKSWIEIFLKTAKA